MITYFIITIIVAFFLYKNGNFSTTYEDIFIVSLASSVASCVICLLSTLTVYLISPKIIEIETISATYTSEKFKQTEEDDYILFNISDTIYKVSNSNLCDDKINIIKITKKTNRLSPSISYLTMAFLCVNPVVDQKRFIITYKDINNKEHEKEVRYTIK